MLKLLFSIICLLICFESFSQKDFRSGYYITNQNDTIQGFIHYAINSKSIESCIFKKNETDPVVYLSPSEIKSFGYLNDTFLESKNIESIKPNQKIFVEVLVKGKVSLLKYDGVFFMERDSTIYPLYITFKDTVVNNLKYKALSRHHLSTLHFLLAECDNNKTRISKIYLNEGPLTKLVEHYHQCISASFISYKAHKAWLKFSFEVGGGFIFSNITYVQRHGNSPYPRADFSSSIDPTFGINFNISSPRLTEKISYNTGLFYLRSDYSATLITPLWFGNLQEDLYMKSEELKIPIGIRYTTGNLKKVRPIINLGVSKNILLNEISERNIQAQTGEDPQIIEKGSFKTDRSHGGFWGGTGIQVKMKNNFQGIFEIRYEYTTNIGGYDIQYRRLKANVSNIYTMAGVRF